MGTDDRLWPFTGTTAGEDLGRTVKNAVKEGFAIVLCKPGSKEPLCTLAPRDRSKPHDCGHKHAITTEREALRAVRWAQKQYPDQQINIGVKCNLSRIAVADLDNPGQLQAFIADPRWNGVRPDLTVASPGTQRNGEWIHQGGGHTYFQIPEGVELPEYPGEYVHESGWVLFWGEHYVLTPPSVRPEGAYTFSHMRILPLPQWLIDTAQGLVQERKERSTDSPTDIDEWDSTVLWSDLLKPEHGWEETGRPDRCGCPIWHVAERGSTKSATAHDIDCSKYPGLLHFWTTEPPDFIRGHGKSFTKLKYLALAEHGGDRSAAMRAVGITPRVPVDYTEIPTDKIFTANGQNFDPFEGKEKDRTSWWPRSIVERATELAEAPSPSHLRREDDRCLMYAKRVNGIIGESESGKSWIALLAIVQAVEAGQRVLILDFEDSPNSVYQRLVSLGLSVDQLPNVHYADPDESLGAAQNADIKEAMANAYDVILVDGVNAAMTLMNYNLESNTDATMFFRVLLRPLAQSGACVITVDHVPKNPEQRGKGGIGAQAKRAMVDGSQLTAEVQEPFGKGQSGTIKLTVDKDRNGAVRGISGGGKYAGKAHIASIQDIVRIHIEAPDLRPVEEQDWKPTGVMEQVSKFLERQDKPVSFNIVDAGVTAKEATTKKAIQALEEGGYIRLQDGPRRSILHASIKPYREDSPLSPTVARLSPGDSEVTVATVARTTPEGGTATGDSRRVEGDAPSLDFSGDSEIPPGYSACNRCGDHVFDSIIEATGGFCVACGRDR